MNPFHQFISVAKERVRNCEDRYPEYHVDLVRILSEIVAKQDEGLSDQKRRVEIAEIVYSFGSTVAAKQGDK